MSDDLDILAEMITPDPVSGGLPATFDTGTVTQAIDATHIKVDLGDKEVTAYVPASIAGAAPVGASVRVSIQENTYVLDSVLQGAAVSGVPVGSMVMWMSTTIPTGWLKCDGSTFSAATYPLLAAYFGGGTTLPNFSDRFPIGSSGTKAVASTGGSATVTQTTAQMPSHTHSTPDHTHSIPSHTHTMSHTHSTPDHTHSIATHSHTMSHTHNMAHTHTQMGWVFNGAGASGTHYGHTFQNNTGSEVDMGVNSETDNNYNGGASTTTTGGSSAANTGTGGPTITGSDGASTTGGSSAANTGSGGSGTSGSDGASTTGSAGTGNAMTVLNPYLSVNMIIKAG